MTTRELFARLTAAMGALLKAHGYEATLDASSSTIFIRKRVVAKPQASLFRDRSEDWDEWAVEKGKS